MIKKIVYSLLIVGLFFPLTAKADNIVGEDNNVKSYIIGDFETDKIFYKKNENDAMPIASMSKLMTFLVIKDEISKGKLQLNTKVKITKEAEELATWEFSHLGLKAGMEMSIEDLLKGLLVVSGNDCAVALAIKSSGDEASFALKMNKKAKELGLSSQNYVNASGIQDEKKNLQNSSSAYDMYKLSKHIIKKYPEILDYAKIRHLDFDEYDIHEDSTIPLVDEIDGVDGLKTGTTEEAGACLTTTVDMKKIDKSDNFRTIAVVMNAKNHEVRDLVAKDLIYYVSRYFNFVDVVDKDKVYKTLKLNSSKKGYIDLYSEKNLKYIVKVNDIVDQRVDLYENIKAPIEENQALGNIEVNYNGNKETTKLISKSKEEKASYFVRIYRTIKDTCDFIIDLVLAS